MPPFSLDGICRGCGIRNSRQISAHSPGGVVLAGVLTAIVAVLIGSCCMVLLGSRTDFRLRT